MVLNLLPIPAGKPRTLIFFETLLKIVDIKHRYTRPYRPQTNGKIERFWKILNNECIRLQTQSQTEQEFIAELNGYMYLYNYHRRHSAFCALFDLNLEVSNTIR
jgi:transposase InsO family protein